MEEKNIQLNTEEVSKILINIKECVVNNNFIVSRNQNRLENSEFINNYRISTEKTKKYFIKYWSYWFLLWYKK